MTRRWQPTAAQLELIAGILAVIADCDKREAIDVLAAACRVVCDATDGYANDERFRDALKRHVGGMR